MYQTQSRSAGVCKQKSSSLALKTSDFATKFFPVLDYEAVGRKIEAHILRIHTWTSLRDAFKRCQIHVN